MREVCCQREKCETVEIFVEVLYNALVPAINKVGIENIKGISAANGNMHTGNIAYAPNLLPIFQSKIKLLCSELREADAAILGASDLVWESKTEETQPKMNRYQL